MGYTVVKSFERGIDTRKLIDTTEAGTLIDARDCHVTLGGELEKRAAFFVKATLPDTTVGLWVTPGRTIHTWGDAPATSPPAGLPAGAVYHPAPDPDGSPLAHILSVEEFNSSLYVIAQYEDHHILHWYKDILLKIPPNTPEVGGGTPPVTVPGIKPKTQYNISMMPQDGSVAAANQTINYVYLLAPGSVRNWGVDAWLVIPETGTLSGWPVGGAVITSPSTPHQVAVGIMAAVNGFVPPVTGAAPVVVKAQASGDSIIFWVDSPGTTYNGWKIDLRVIGNSMYYPNGQATLSGGVAAGGTALLDGDGHSLRAIIDTGPPYTGIAGDPIQKGYFARAHNTRMFSVQGSLLNYSAPRTPDEWLKGDLQAGNIEHSMLTNRVPELVSMADYGGDLAVFGTQHIFVWHIDVVPAGDAKKQTLHGTGTFAPHSVVPYGQSDVMYLDISGIRSLRARDSSEQAFAADIGNLIDDLVRAKVDTSTDAEKFFNYWAIVEPRSGRLWMALHDKIFILSFYPSSRIAAWTYYDATLAPVDMMVTSDQSVYWRSGNNIIIYGDETGTVYDDTEALARLPYIDGGKPATSKNWSGIDLALRGTWSVRGSFDPTVPAALDLLANLTKSTYAQQKIAINGESPAISLELRSTFVGPARIGNAAFHFTDSTAD